MSIADELGKLEELRRSGALNDSEFAQAKAALLNSSATGAEPPLGQHLADQLAEVKYQNELARIDREWEMELRQYLITDRYGGRQVPTTGMGIGVAIGIGTFGVLWTIMAVTITNFAPNMGPISIVKIVFPLFGVVFTISGIGFGLYCYSRAQKHQRAYAAYQRRRDRLKPEQFH